MAVAVRLWRIESGVHDGPAAPLLDDALVRALRQLRAGLEVERAWAAVDGRLRPRLTSYFRAHGLSPADCDDLVQTTLTRVYRGVPGLRDETRFLPWLFVIARNERRRWRVASARQPITGEGEAALEVADPRPDASPEIAGHAAQRLRDADAAIGELPPQQRQCLLLRVVEELSYEEIAATLRLSVHTVRNHLAQARQGLRRRLGEGFGSEEER